MNRLSIKQLKFVEALQTGIDGTAAAIAAGYSRKSARYMAYQLQNENAAVMAALAETREKLAESAEYNGHKCMAECDSAIAFARETKNANALVRAIELRARLSNLLREKIDVTVTDRIELRSVIDEMRARREQGLRLSCDLSKPLDVEYEAVTGAGGGRAIDAQSTDGSGFGNPVDMFA